MPDVSVIMPAFNAGRTIDAAIESVLAQTFTDFELIVIDDGSTDDTALRVSAYGPRAAYCHQPHGGTTRAWLTGLDMASGRLIALLDATDLWMPRKLDRQVRYFATYPKTGLVHGHALSSASPTSALLASSDGVPLQTPFEPPIPSGARKTASRPILTSTVMVRREVLADFLPTSSAEGVGQEQLWSGVAERHTVGYLDLPVAIVRAGACTHAPAAAGGRSLLQDTAFRRVRSSATATVHTVDHLVSRRIRHRQRILFEAASPMSLAVAGPVLRHLRRDPRLELWCTSSSSSWTPQAIFGPAGITDRVVAPEEIRWAKFDGYINTDFWDMTWLPRRTRRVHFFHGVAGKYGLDAPVKIAPVVATFDRLMFPNRDRLHRYAEAGLIDPESAQAALIGYPKVDCLVDGSLSREQTLARVGADASRPTVLYAPTWSPYSSLNSMGHQVVAALGRLDVNAIVKLHDRSYDPAARGSGGVDWRHHLKRVCARHGAHLVEDADASPWLHAADLLITDHSSVGFEFMLLDRPIVVLDSPELITNARVNPQKVTQLRSAATLVRRATAIADVVREALAHPDEHQRQRRLIADELFYRPGSATARAVQCIYGLLELQQPEMVPAPASDRPLEKLAALARIG